jgi:hypothetical protein
MPGRRERPPLTPEQRALADRHWSLARRIADRFDESYPGLAASVDFRGEAAVGLCEAAAAYRRHLGRTFAPLARVRVAGACLDAIRRAASGGYRRTNAHPGRPGPYDGAPAVVSLDAATRPPGDDPGGRPMALADSLEAIGSGDLPVGWEAESQDAVEGIARALPARHATVVRAMALEAGCTFAAAGARIGRSEAVAWRMHAEAIEMLRESYRKGA